MRFAIDQQELPSFQFSAKATALDQPMTATSSADGQVAHVILTDIFKERAWDLEIWRPTSAALPRAAIGQSALSDRFAELSVSYFGPKTYMGKVLQVMVGQEPHNRGMPVHVDWYEGEGLRDRERTEFVNHIERGSESIEEDQVLSLYDWVPVGDQLFAFGALGKERMGDQFKRAFFTFELQRPDRPRRPAAKPFGSIVENEAVVSRYGSRYYRLNQSLLASDLDVAYYLKVGERETVLAAYDSRPEVQNNHLLKRVAVFEGTGDGWEDFFMESMSNAERFKQLEEWPAPVPVGLHLSETGLLAVVFRQFDAAIGRPVWTAHILRPLLHEGLNADGELAERLGTILLPTDPSTRNVQLLANATDADWMMFEFESLKDDAWPPISAVTIPTEWIEIEPSAVSETPQTISPLKLSDDLSVADQLRQLPRCVNPD